MNERLKQAVAEIKLLPDEDQDAIALELRKIAARRRIGAKLAASEARGGAIPHEEAMDQLVRKYGG
jgi:hypothetical protein